MRLATETVAEFRKLIDGAKLTVRERQLLAEIAADAAALHGYATLGLWTPARVARQKAHLDAQLSGLKSIGHARATRLFWKAFNIALAVVTKAILAV